jgi:hypothetical protein
MKFTIVIEGETPTQLIDSLDEARKTLISGGCYLNVGGVVNVLMKPESEQTAEEFRGHYRAAHPRAASWPK